MTLIRLKNFYQLLQLENKAESLTRTNQEDFETLLNFRVEIENNLHWQVKDEYLELLDDFFKKNISSEEFATLFINKYFNVSKKLENFENLVRNKQPLDFFFKNSNLLQLWNEPTEEQINFSKLLTKLEGDCEVLSLDPELNSTNFFMTEEEFEQLVEKIYKEVQILFKQSG